MSGPAPMPLNPRFAATLPPPVPEAYRWLAEIPHPPDLPVMNLSQAAPVEPPHPDLRAALAHAVLHDPKVHLYSPVLGWPDLRERLAARTQAIYGGQIRTEQIALTSGCNQAFCASIATLAAGGASAGDQVILPTPWYFNHAMWLSMNGIEAVPLATGTDLMPDVAACARLITPRTKAIVLVTPNNPGGVEYPPALLTAFAELATRHKIALIIDETYRDFQTADGPPHDLFTNPDWDQTLIHLYSFSKAYRLTGHRVGAIAASPQRLSEIEKFLDTVAICVSGPGQMAALWGLENLAQWLATERLEILRRRSAIAAGLQTLPDWTLMGCGAYFAYVRHPFEAPSPAVAKRLLSEAGVLMLPGTMFRPTTDPKGAKELRIAFANADTSQIGTLIQRLQTVT